MRRHDIQTARGLSRRTLATLAGAALLPAAIHVHTRLEFAGLRCVRGRNST